MNARTGGRTASLSCKAIGPPAAKWFRRLPFPAGWNLWRRLPGPISLCLLTGWLALAGLPCSGQTERQDRDLRVVEAVLSHSTGIKPGQSAYPVPRAFIDLGPLAAARQHEFELRILNDTDEDLRFRKVVAGCACGRIEFESRVLPAHAVTVARLAYTPPRVARSARYSLTLTLHDDSDDPEVSPVAVFWFSGELTDLLVIDDSQARIEVPETGPARFILPVQSNPPVRPAELYLSLSPSLSAVRAEVLEIDGQVVIAASAEPESVGPEPLHGWIRLLEKRSGREATAHVRLARRAPLTIHPFYLRFLPVEDDPTRYRATALVRVVPRREEEPAGEITRMTCQYGETAVELEALQIGDSIYRVRAELPAAVFEEKSGSETTGEAVSQSEPVLDWHFEIRPPGEEDLKPFVVSTPFGGMFR